MSKEFDDFMNSVKQLDTCIACDEEKETYVICMDCIVKTNHEISDEEIFKQAILAMEEMYGSGSETEIDAYFRGAKWMQEQLRQPK